MYADYHKENTEQVILSLKKFTSRQNASVRNIGLKRSNIGRL